MFQTTRLPDQIRIWIDRGESFVACERSLKQNSPGAVGYCLPNTECKIVDPDTHAELDANETGEIWIRGPQVMKGYLGNPEATREMID